MAETDTVVARPWVCQYDGCPAGPNDPPCDCNGCVGARLQAENEALRRERDEARGNLSSLTLEVMADIQKTAAELRQEDFRHVSVNTLMGAVKMFIAATRLLCQTAAAETAQKAAEAAREAAEAKAARLKEALVAQRAFILHWTDDVNGGLKPTLGSLRSALDAVSAALEAK